MSTEKAAGKPAARHASLFITSYDARALHPLASGSSTSLSPSPSDDPQWGACLIAEGRGFLGAESLDLDQFKRIALIEARHIHPIPVLERAMTSLGRAAKRRRLSPGKVGKLPLFSYPETATGPVHPGREHVGLGVFP